VVVAPVQPPSSHTAGAAVYTVAMRKPWDRRQWADQQLLTGIAACDERAFSVFYRRHLRLVVGWLMSRTADPELTADLTAEVFASAMLAAGRYQAQQESADAWLVGIARNVLGHSLRRGRVDAQARRRLGAQPMSLDDHDLERVHDIVAANQLHVSRYLVDLPADERVAVQARIVDEREYREIADALGCSELVVRKRVSRGLARLRMRVAQG
jgi:RNA polymerase sigma factor (sigma-70 family)